MTNDIGSISQVRPQTVADPETKPNQPHTAAGDAQNARSAHPDRVTLTDTGLQRHASETAASAGEPVDRQKVEAVRAAINSGTYSVNAEAIAEKMLQLDQQLFSDGKTSAG